jgi:hypothetical protein
MTAVETPEVESSPDRKVDGRDGPDACRRREAPDDLAPCQDRACTQKAYSGNDLSGHAGRIKDDVFGREAVAKSGRGDDHDQASADTNHHVGANAGSA